jgi:hypothetical protein
VKRVGKTEFGRDLLHQRGGILQSLGGKVHLQAQEELVGRLVVVAAEQTAEIGRVDVTLLGDLPERFQAGVLRLNVLAAALVGGKGGCLGRFARHERFGDLDDQIVDQRGAELIAITRGFQPILNKTVENILDFNRGENQATIAGRQAVLVQQVETTPPGEIDKILHQRLLGVGGDIVGNIACIGEDGTRQQVAGLPGERQPAASLGDELDGRLGERSAMDGIVGLADFAAAADHR